MVCLYEANAADWALASTYVSEDLRGPLRLDRGQPVEEEPHDISLSYSFIFVPDKPHGLHTFGEFFDASRFCLGLVSPEITMD